MIAIVASSYSTDSASISFLSHLVEIEVSLAQPDAVARLNQV